jgi:hypothetical protein
MKRLLTALLALSLTALAHAQTYDATTDFSITQGNANGAWSYGFSSTLGGALTLFDVTDSFPSWKHSVVQSLGAPTIGRNDTGGDIYGIPMGFLDLHPGSTEYTVLRFTAPSTASYSLLAQCFIGDIGDTEMFVVHNNNTVTPLFFAATTDTNPTFSTSLSLTLGDTVDLVVGKKADFFFDSTPAVFTLIGSAGASAPEPGTIGLFTVGGLVWIVRRRRVHQGN